MNILYLETGISFIISGISFPSWQHKRSVYVFIGLHCLLHSHHSMFPICFTLSSILSSSSSLLLLLIYPMFVFGSISKGFKEFKSGISFLLKLLSLVLFSFPCFFFCLPQFISLFRVIDNKKDWLKCFCPHWLRENMFLLVNKRPYISFAKDVEIWVLKEKNVHF